MHNKLVNFAQDIYQTKKFIPLHAPTFSGNASATLPQPDADVNFTVSSPTFSVVAIVGGIAIIVDDETNITLKAQSTNIDLPVLSNNLEI